VLATSRESLGVDGEQVWSVPPMELPRAVRQGSAGSTAQSEAVQLFVERAGASRPDSVLDASNQSAVTDLCHRLDGLPLALELVAAQVRGLAPEQLSWSVSTNG
jgi:predicted ATPase